MHTFDEELLWDALRSFDKTYDGVFFYAVKSTGIFCKPSCKSRTPLKSNVRYFSISSLAMEEGFRPCKRCRPDLVHPYEEAVVEAAKTMIELEYTASITLDRLAISVGVSKYHLQRVFKRKTGISPLEYLTDKRMSQAVNLLLNHTDTVTEIALSIGYNSSSHFSVAFKNHFGCSPTEYRNEHKEEIRN
ncbi:bifunctional transcriptional activator/DNA repair enzyme AdaA [Bacillus sp. V59.32b]|uniref:bifunctional transcriptional activator/DNA repair enzyme AdaA n=1 Tax=Bacillus sp. V59.32b TaxID=1758642 RepID=UPI000E3DDE1B|nr:bifunctional transcriptional activator/DNA repair enzyme AdaA [Bacillus sp. V59.32b]RFU60305.1 helix-turn-helix domain-containing protein [Bacillus sp. V59.32b]